MIVGILTALQVNIARGSTVVCLWHSLVCGNRNELVATVICKKKRKKNELVEFVEMCCNLTVLPGFGGTVSQITWRMNMESISNFPKVANITCMRNDSGNLL